MNLRAIIRSDTFKYVFIVIVLLASVWYFYRADSERKSNTSTIRP